jgi:hypothetical protein
MRTEQFIRAGIEFRMDTVKNAEDVVSAFEYRRSAGRDKGPELPARKTL